MTHTRVEHRAAAVSLVTGLSIVLSVGFQLISVPICLHFWGIERYGAWLTIFTASTMFRTVDGGFINFVGNRLNLLYHADHSALRSVLASSTVGVAILGVVQLGLVLIAVSVGRHGGLFGAVADMPGEEGRLGLVILVVVWIFSGSYLGIVHRLLIPSGLMYQAAWWSMGLQASLFFAVVIAALARMDLLGASMLIGAVQAAVYLASAVYIRRRLPEFFPWWKHPDWRTGLADLRGSSIFLLSGVFQQSATSGVVLLISAKLGVGVLPAFTTVRTMANLWNNVTTTLTSPLLPDVIRYHASQQTEKILSLTQAHAWLLGSVVNIGIVLAYPFLLVAYGYWTGGKLTLDMSLFAALLGAVALANAGALMNLYLSGINHARAVLWLAFLRAVLTLGVGWFAISLGLSGIGLGIVIAEFACFTLVSVHFFPDAMQQVDGKRQWPRLQWAWVSLMCVLLFLFAAAIEGGFPRSAFGLSLLGMATASWLGWRELDVEVRGRLLLLVARYTRIGMKA